MQNIAFLQRLLNQAQQRQVSPTSVAPPPAMPAIQQGDDARQEMAQQQQQLPQIETLGGTTAERPDLPQIPLNTDPPDTPEYQAWQADQERNQAPQQTLPAIEPPTTPEQELADVNNKRYNKGVWRNPETGETTSKPNKPGFTEVVTAPGKDRDKRWSTWDKIGSALVGWATGGLAGGIKAATDRNYFEKMGDQFQRERLLPQIAAKQQIGKYEADQEYGRVRNENIRADNDRLLEDQKIRRELGTQRIRSTALNRILGLKHFDPKNPTHAAAAQSAGLSPEDLQGWDDRNPVEKQVAGVTYRLNRQTGAYEPTNLPLDESKTLTDYTVAMPNGETRTYKVAQKDAASFATQMHALGLNLNDRERQRDFTAGENQKNRALTLQRDALKMQMDAAIKQYDAAVRSQNQAQAQANRERLLQLKEQYDALDN